MNNKFKFAFTLSEVLVCLTLVAVLATLLVPTIKEYKPNKNKVMFKKAYQLAERAIVELVNDNDLYPDAAGVNGFDNVSKVRVKIGRLTSNSSESFGNLVEISEADKDGIKKVYVGTDKPTEQVNKAKAKFCILFGNMLNPTKEVVCGAETNFTTSPSLITNDGIYWYLPNTNFTNSGDKDKNLLAWKKILIDVNGPKSPNKSDTETGTAKCDGNIDRFTIYVRSDGKMQVQGVCAREFLNDVSLANRELSKKTNTEMGAATLSPPWTAADGPAHIAGSTDGQNSYWDEK